MTDEQLKLISGAVIGVILVWVYVISWPSGHALTL